MNSLFRLLPIVICMSSALTGCGSDSSVNNTATTAPSGVFGESADAVTTSKLQSDIKTVVVIYAENRGFDNIYGLFPGADGIPGVNPTAVGTYVPQTDRDAANTVLAKLPKVWGGVTASGQAVTVPEGQTAAQDNIPFQIDANAAAGGFQKTGVVVDQTVITRDLYHRFFNNQMQINGGKNDKFAAYADSGGLVMGYYDGSKMAMWKLAKQYALADNFFQGAFGGSFLNHQYLICACAPIYPANGVAVTSASNSISVLNAGTNSLTQSAASPASAITGIPTFVNDSTLTPLNYAGDNQYHGVNTMQPPYQPSSTAPLAGADVHTADYTVAKGTLPPQTTTTIGDLLDKKGVNWAWYAGGYNTTLSAALGSRKFNSTVPNFQFHHQPFNYFSEFDPTQPASLAYRNQHMKDFDASFLQDAAAGTLPAVSFYKPQGNLNQHAGYANISDGDAHIANVIAQLQKSPQWKNMVVVVTYDENGGFWDHKQVPKGDFWGPGTRIPAIIISPWSKKNYIDHTQYDTASILRFITRTFGLETLPGLTQRDAALVKNGGVKMGDLTNSLDFTQTPAS